MIFFQAINYLVVSKVEATPFMVLLKKTTIKMKLSLQLHFKSSEMLILTHSN